MFSNDTTHQTQQWTGSQVIVIVRRQLLFFSQNNVWRFVNELLI